MGKASRKIKQPRSAFIFGYVSARQGAVNPRFHAGHRSAAEMALHWLPRSRVITVPKEVLGLAPLATRRDVAEAFAAARAPFDATFLDLDERDVEWIEPTGARTFRLHGALVLNTQGFITINALLSDQGRIPGWVVRTAQDMKGTHYQTNGGDTVPQPADAPAVGQEAWTVILSALALLESVNVETVERPAPPLPRAFEGKIPHFEVDVRVNGKRYVYPEHETAGGTYSHRWEVRGHFKHFTKGPTLEAALRDRPEKVLTGAEGAPCVRVWCPPHVKGPGDKPLLPKIRTVAA